MDIDAKPPEIKRLVELVSRLRAPDGCPWDREQTMPDLRAYLLEEAHEVADAIDREDLADLRGELGDLLFQIVFLTHLGREAGAFDLADVIEGIHTKMVARHPHVFGEKASGEGGPADAGAVRKAWEVRKLEEGDGERSLLEGVARSVPALLAAYRMTQKAAGVGFDWPDVRGVLEKVREELEELEEALGQHGEPSSTGPPASKEAIREEIGDLLFALVNLARKVEVDPEAALAGSNLKFRRRFRHIEARLREQARTLADADLEEMDALWNEAKERERE